MQGCTILTVLLPSDHAIWIEVFINQELGVLKLARICSICSVAPVIKGFVLPGLSSSSFPLIDFMSSLMYFSYAFLVKLVSCK